MPIKILFTAAVLGAIAYVGNADYADELAHQAYQCDMIQSGHWPESVNPSCREVSGNE